MQNGASAFNRLYKQLQKLGRAKNWFPVYATPLLQYKECASCCELINQLVIHMLKCANNQYTNLTNISSSPLCIHDVNVAPAMGRPLG